jgi:hypothetical protein
MSKISPRKYGIIVADQAVMEKVPPLVEISRSDETDVKPNKVLGRISR